MAWRSLHISTTCRLMLADRQCVIAREEDETRVAIEDIAYVILDTPSATLTTALITACMEAGVAIMVTDERHNPSGLMLPFHRHHRQAEVTSFQLQISKVLKDSLWQKLVRSKIGNQASVLSKCGTGETPLRAMIERVLPGDPDNVEARAARHYWPRLFSNFTREDSKDLRNAMLNYGYAVMRGAVGRGLVSAGLVPSIGLHHASALNPFNLADDMIEPFRPIVDQLVWKLSNHGASRTDELTLEHRRALAGVLFEPVRLGRETVTVLVATENAAAALVRALASLSASLLVLPEIVIA